MIDIDVLPLNLIIIRKIPLAFLVLDIETIPRPTIDEVVEEAVAKAYEEGNIASIEEYVMRDVEATHQLFEKLRQYIK